MIPTPEQLKKQVEAKEKADAIKAQKEASEEFKKQVTEFKDFLNSKITFYRFNPSHKSVNDWMMATGTRFSDDVIAHITRSLAEVGWGLSYKEDASYHNTKNHVVNITPLPGGPTKQTLPIISDKKDDPSSLPIAAEEGVVLSVKKPWWKIW